MSGRAIYQHHPIVGYHYIPNLQVRIPHESGSYLFRTNGAGFRSPHEFRPQRQGKRRILLFGDSFTAAEGVSDGLRYGDHLERLVPDCEVFNFAVPGTGTDQHYLLYREFAKSIDHDLIVIAVLVENIRRIVARYRPFSLGGGEQAFLAKPFFTLGSSGALALGGVPVPKRPILPHELPDAERGYVDVGGRFQWARRTLGRMGAPVKDGVQRLLRYQPLPEYDAEESPAWLLMKSLLRQWTEELGKPVIIMPIPLYQHVEGTATPNYQTKFAGLARDAKVTVHDPLTDYQRLSREQRRAMRFAVDVHPTPAHHLLLAESLAKAVRDRLAGPL